MQHVDVDVVVVGASIAGCSAARLLGRAGQRVLLIERKADPDAYKALCGHFILGGTKASLERQGLWEPMLAAGAEVGWASVWSGAGWIAPVTEAVPPAISLRRATLDPLLRRLAAAAPNVEVVLGAAVTGLVRDDAGGVNGVAFRDGSDERVVRAKLVLGADGHRSAVGRLAGAAEATAPNGRGFWWSYYRGLELPRGTAAQIWPEGADTAVVVPAGEGLHLVGAFVAKAQLPGFAGDRAAAVERFVAGLPDAPDFGQAERVGRAIGTNDYPFVKRDPLPVPGVALIGDAAMASDPLPAVGCGWAFRTAEWLVDAALPALRDEQPLPVALEGYRAARADMDAYDELARADAAAPAANPMQAALRRAAVHDRELARRLGMFAMRAAPPSVLVNDDTISRVQASPALAPA